MASGRLGVAALAANTDTPVYEVPADTLAVVNINVCNRGDSVALVRLAIASTGTPGNSEYIEYEYPLAPRGVLERTGFVCDTGKRVVARDSTGTCTVLVHGFEEAV
ncbi:MAG: hypothetical protein Q8K97_12465 [Pseudohongiella sp.]|nr:hypothetical protein [Pseudohongiella sp.]